MTVEERPVMFPRSVYRDLLEDDGFAAWIENVSRGSKVRAEVALRRMGRICGLFQVTQRDLAKMSRGEAGDFLFRVVSRLEKEGNRSSSIAGYMKTLRGWWLFNDLEVTRRVRLSRYVGLYDNERVPNRQELHSIFEHADPQKRVCIALMAFSERLLTTSPRRVTEGRPHPLLGRGKSSTTATTTRASARRGDAASASRRRRPQGSLNATDSRRRT